MKKIKKVKPGVIDRREFLLGFSGFCFGAGLALASNDLIGLIAPPQKPHPKPIILPLESMSPRPDETFFNVMDAFKIPYKNADVAPFMQPPAVSVGTDGCPSNSGGCGSLSLVKVGNGDLPTVAHEMGHSTFFKYRKFMEEEYFLAHPEEFVLVTEYEGFEHLFHVVSTDVEFTKIDNSNALGSLTEATEYMDSYPGYPKSKTIRLYWSESDKNSATYSPSSTFQEFVAFCAEKSVVKHDPLQETDDIHRNGTELFYHVKDTYGDDAVPLVGGATVMADAQKYDLSIDEVGYGKTVVNSLAKELGF